jgi:iron complex outermembrane receptor protein
MEIKLLCVIFFINIVSLIGSPNNDTTKVSNKEEIIVIANRVPTTYTDAARIVYTINQRELINLPSNNISDILTILPGTDTRQRGAMGVQTDISIRGGTFDQTLILVDGVKVSDPQSGHHSMNLPISKEDIERIEILEGPGSRVLGTNAYSGAINIITKKNGNTSANIAINGGQNGYYDFFASGNYQYDSTNLFNNYLSINKNGSSGYTDNTDFQILNLLYKTNLNTQIGNFEGILGYNDRSFGANSFYSPDFPNEFEQTQTTFSYLKYSKNFNSIIVNGNINWRKHQDKFELFRSNPASWYSGHNYHLTNIFGTEINTTLISEIGFTSIGLEYKNENIKSNILGNSTGDTIPVGGDNNAFFTKEAKREISNIYFEQVYHNDKLSLSGGLLANYTSNYQWNFYTGFDLGYKLDEVFRVVSSLNQSLRMPTFTDLYYADPSNKGNPNLEPEKAVAFEIGLKANTEYLSSFLSIYQRFGSQTIDWVRQNDTAIWKSMNITDLNTFGFDFCISYSFSEQFFIPVKFITINYSYVDLNKNSSSYTTNYSMDYLKNKVMINIEHRILSELGINWKLSLIDRNGSYYDSFSKSDKEYKPYFMLDVKLFFSFDSINLYLEATNLTNIKYVEHNKIPTPDRWLIFGIKYSIR